MMKGTEYMKKLASLLSVFCLLLMLFPVYGHAAASDENGVYLTGGDRTYFKVIQAKHNGSGAYYITSDGTRLGMMYFDQSESNKYITIRDLAPQYDGKVWAYCVEHGAAYGHPVRDSQDLMNSVFWVSLSKAAQDGIKLATIYGFPAATPAALGVSSIDDAFAATQVIIWEYQTGARVGNTLYDSTLYATVIQGSPAEPAYNKIVDGIGKHKTAASFQNLTLSLKYDTSTKKYTGSVTDTKGVLSGYAVTSGLSGVSTSISGNTLTVTSDKPLNGTSSITLTRNLPQLSQHGLLALKGLNNGEQTIISGVAGKDDDPVRFSLSLRTEELKGNIRIIKTSEDGIVDGMRFVVSGSGGIKRGTTANGGICDITDLPAGTYTVTEQSTPDRYIIPTVRFVAVQAGKTTTVSFQNNLKKGFVEIQKTDNTSGVPLPNAVYGLYNSQNQRLETLTTDANGYAKSMELLFGTGYYVQEETAPDGYVVDPTKRYFSITTDKQVVTIQANNTSQMGQINLVKTDGETDQPVKGTSVFEIKAASDIVTPDGTVRLKAGALADTVTAQDGAGTSKQLFLGEYVVQEKQAPEGYVLDGRQYSVSLEYGGQTIKVVTQSITVPNTPQMGQITVSKIDAETKRPVVNAAGVFEIYAKWDVVTGDGTVRYAAGELVDTITTMNGTAVSKRLYLGVYDVTELTAPSGYVLDPTPQEVTLSYGGQTVELVTESLTFANVPQKGKVIVQKTDAGTGELIAGAPAIFEVRAKENIVTADGTVRLEAGALADTLTTADGSASSKELYLGTYTVQEITAPDGYVQDTTVYDVVLSYGQQTVKVVTSGVTIGNAPQMGQIVLVKRDAETGKPIINAEAEFDITAKEDIITADGTLRYRAGELIEHLTTASGTITTKALYLGTYIITETKAPDGYILDATPHEVTLAYGGQSVDVVTENLSIDNAPQMGTISLEKRDKETGQLITGADAIFEIRAKEDVVTADGTIRYTAGQLVDTITTKDGKAVSKLLYLGKYAVEEVTAPEGYLLDDTIYIVTLSYGGQDVEVVTESLVVVNAPQMGQIVIRKVDAETGKLIIMSSATFEIYAAEDIITPDGTIRYKKGTLVDTIVTVDGVGTSKLLYLGQYTVVETIAPDGYVLDTAPYTAALEYDGQIATMARYMSAMDNAGHEQSAAPDNQEPSGSTGTSNADKDIPKNKDIVEVPNKKIVEVPQTGRPLPVGMILLAAVSGALILVCRKKHKK